MRIVVTGATGFIGSALVPALRARGDQVVAITRDRAGAQGLDAELVEGELETAGPWLDALDGADAVVHLAGAPIAGARWTSRIKQAIRDSRVESTHLIAQRMRGGVLVCASGVDYYAFAEGPGDFADDDVPETDPPGDSFLARVCKAWEAEAAGAEAHGVRVVRMRTGLVLGPGGGGLAKMTTPFKMFVGGKIGGGKQWVSWIHRDDVVAAYAAAIADPRWTGPINLIRDSVRAAALARALGKALGRPSWLPVPAFALRAAVGELAEYLLNGRKVVPRRLEQLGFGFQHPDLVEAIATSVRARTSEPAGSGSAARP